MTKAGCNTCQVMVEDYGRKGRQLGVVTAEQR